jgi:hypothetical protein
LACAAGLFVLHLGGILMRMTKHESYIVDMVSEGFWWSWLVMPVIVGCSAIAEERKLGMVEGQLCLPVSSRTQFAVKFLLTMVLGAFLGGVMPCLLERCGIAFGEPSTMGAAGMIWDSSHPLSQVCLFLIAWSLGLTLVAFFASTLARNILQAMGITIIGSVVFNVFLLKIWELFDAVHRIIFHTNLGYHILTCVEISRSFT